MTDTRSLALTVLTDGWSATELAPQTELATVDTAIAEMSQALRSLAERESNLDGKQAIALRDALKAIGAKTWPTMGDARTEWLSAMVLALSDLPGGYVVDAARAAIHTPYRFHNEVEPRIRELVAERLEKRTLAAHRLRMLRAEIERGLAPTQAQLEHQPKVWTEAEVAATNRSFAKLGIRTRYRLDANGEVSNYSVEVLDTEENGADMGDGTQGD